VDQASDWAVAARADDEQVERCAVQRELFGGSAVGCVRLYIAESRDVQSLASSTSASIVSLSGKGPGPKAVTGRTTDRAVACGANGRVAGFRRRMRGELPMA